VLIDWFTVGAQALNFLVLIYLMKRFLYKPILHAIDEREKRIAAELADADAKRAEAKKEQDAFRQKNEDFDRERGALLRKATKDAQTERERLLDAARHSADALAAKREEALRTEARALGEALTRRTRDVVFQIARRALEELATTSLEERLGEVFTRRLAEMSSETKEQLERALKSAPETAVVRSAFELPAREQGIIRNALNETFAADVELRFEVAPSTISGIELSCGGQKIGWSIDDYLTSLEQGVTELLADKTVPNPTAKAEPKGGAPVRATAATPAVAAGNA